MSSRPSLSVVTQNPSLVATARPSLVLGSVTPGGAESVSRSPRTKKGRPECGTEPTRFPKCSVVCDARVEEVEQDTDMGVQEFRTHSLCNGLPHVAPILDYEESTPQGKRWWVKMDNYPNYDLLRYIENTGKPSVDFAYKWARQIAIGLDGIHNAGVIHRDIKLENIFFRCRPECVHC